jgi:F0F1-type ATP synthase assembly protein I
VFRPMDDGTSRPASSPSSGGSPEGPVGEAAAWTALAYLITGPLLYGGLGWLLDRWLNTRFFIVVGLIGGMALAVYVIYVRYGQPGSAPPAPGESDRRNG